MPAETSDTARLRLSSNHAVVAAIIGAKKALAARPTRMPYVSWNWVSDVAALASDKASPSSTAPISTTMRVPKRSLTAPQPKAPRPMTRKLRVMALDMPARDQPVAVDIGSRKTASENIAPMATQVMSAPTPTITQR